MLVMSLPEQAAFCQDKLSLEVNKTVQPYEWVRRFDLAQSAKRVNQDLAHLPIVERTISIEDTPARLYMYGDLPTNNPDLKLNKPRSLHRYFRRKKWTNERIPDFPVGMCLSFTIDSVEQFARLQRYELEVGFANKKYILDCINGFDRDVIIEFLEKSNNLRIHNFDLEEWNYELEVKNEGEMEIPPYNPFPAHPDALSFLTVTLRQEKDDGKGEKVTHPLDQKPPTYSPKQLVLV